MQSHYGLFKKSCTSNSGYIPVKATDHVLFENVLYLMPVQKYRTTIAAQVHFTISKGGKHVTSLFQSKNGPWYYGDIMGSNDALLILLDGLQMEIFLFPDQRQFAEAFALNTDKLPLADIRLKGKVVNKEKFQRQLLCYQSQQLTII